MICVRVVCEHRIDIPSHSVATAGPITVPRAEGDSYHTRYRGTTELRNISTQDQAPRYTLDGGEFHSLRARGRLWTNRVSQRPHTSGKKSNRRRSPTRRPASLVEVCQVLIPTSYCYYTHAPNPKPLLYPKTSRLAKSVRGACPRRGARTHTTHAAHTAVMLGHSQFIAVNIATGAQLDADTRTQCCR